MLKRGMVAALLGVVMVAGCTAEEPAPAPDTTHRKWPTHDQWLRPVDMTYRDGLAYVFAETSAQALCDALNATEWDMVLGDGVARVVQSGSTGHECMVVRGSLTIRLEMTAEEPFDLAEAESGDIDGHHAWLRTGYAAVEVAPRGSPSPARPLLSMTTTDQDPHTRWKEVDAKLRRLLTMLLTRLAHDGPATPVDGVFTPTEPVRGVPLSDLPRPVQALVLCSAMASTGAQGAPQITLDGGCSAGGRTAQVTEDKDPHGTSQFTIGGREAGFGDDGLLRIELARSLEPIEWRFVRLTLGWPGADQPTIQEWASGFANHVGEL